MVAVTVGLPTRPSLPTRAGLLLLPALCCGALNVATMFISRDVTCRISVVVAGAGRNELEEKEGDNIDECPQGPSLRAREGRGVAIWAASGKQGAP